MTIGCRTGTGCARAGSPFATLGDSILSQSFTVTPGEIQLSFYYKMTCPDSLAFDWATATLQDHTAGTSVTILPKVCNTLATWTRVTASVVAGHSYTLNLISHDDNISTNPSFTLFDDISLVTVSTAPSLSPTSVPSVTPTSAPSISQVPTTSFSPTNSPSVSIIPSVISSIASTTNPSYIPTVVPSVTPTSATTTSSNVFTNSRVPSIRTTFVPSVAPTKKPSFAPSVKPTKVLTNVPTKVPTKTPTSKPSRVPSRAPSKKPTVRPS
jgi:hypothetical protein